MGSWQLPVLVSGPGRVEGFSSGQDYTIPWWGCWLLEVSHPFPTLGNHSWLPADPSQGGCKGQPLSLFLVLPVPSLLNSIILLDNVFEMWLSIYCSGFPKWRSQAYKMLLVNPPPTQKVNTNVLNLLVKIHIFVLNKI